MDKPGTHYKHVDLEAVLGVGRPSAASLRRRLFRYTLWGGAAALLLIGIYLWLGGTGPSLSYVVEPVTRTNITTIVTATGTVEPTHKVDVSSELSGIVRHVGVDYNATVKVGDVLAELDTDKLSAAVDNARAKLVVARAQVGVARATVEETRLVYQRKKALLTTPAGSQQDVDTAKAAHDRARATEAATQADVGSAAAQLALDETNLKKAQIVSPINGIVLSRNVDPGQTVASSFQAPVLFTIAEDLREIEIQIDVDEADVGMVREGQEATFTVDAYPDRTFRASIRELRFGSQVVQGVITYKAVLTADNSALLLRPGMTATAEIAVEEVENAVTVPNAALRFAPPVEEQADDGTLLSRLLPRMPRFRPASPNLSAGGKHTVWVLKDGVPTAMPVATGATDGRRTVVLEGDIAVGDDVIVDTATAKQ